MQIAAFADLPTDFELPDVQPDLVILLGDISVKHIVRIDRKYNCPKVGILGNHDKPRFFEETSITNVHATTVTVNGIKIAGFQGCPQYNSKPFGQHTDEEVERFLSLLEPVDIFIAHSNPVYAHTDRDSHRGFKAYNNLIKHEPLKYFLHGHIHEPLQFHKDGTTVHSVYPFLQFKY